MKIYTKTGDAGETGLYGGSRRVKSDIRIQAYGEVDELQANLGVVQSFASQNEPLCVILSLLQKDLFIIACELARTETKPERKDPTLNEERLVWMESEIDRLELLLPQLTQFIEQGGGLAGAHLHLARAVCRRAERAVVTLSQKEKVAPLVLRYLNRLSDFLFVLARTANQEEGSAEVPLVI